MANNPRTPEQQAAVDSRGGTTLVSAAAGSGKTKVLVDRLLERVCDPEQPQNLNEFLIITYTRAAAAELRGKIAKALSERLAETPGNRHLQRQRSLLYLTQISTVHAFCANLLRSYTHVLELPPDFRVAEESACVPLRQRAMDATLDAAYARLEAEPELARFFASLGAGRDDQTAADLILTVYSAARSHPNPDGWLRACRDSLNLSDACDAAQTPWGAALLAALHAFAAEQRETMQNALAQIARDDRLAAAYGPAFSADLMLLDACLNAKSWDEVHMLCPVKFARLTGVRKFEDLELLERLKAVREDEKDGLGEALAPFSVSSDEAMAGLRAAAPALLGLLTLTEEFTKNFSREKQRQNMLDFGDLEHETIRLLLRPDGTPSDAARETAARYREILVDEYQDSNAVQDLIFRAVSKDEKNCFFVGDVKQSIYRFRLADPTIFLKRYRAYRDASALTPEDAADGEPRKILLSRNFRSDAEILHAVNFVFSNVMSERVGDLSYGPAEALYPPEGAAEGAPAVELHAITMDLEAGEDEAELTRTEAEARFAARRIARLLTEPTLPDGQGGLRPAKPGEIAILLRSTASAGPVFSEALREQGIACAADRAEPLLATDECSVLLSLLRVIDNPRQDIPLLAVLASPVFGFSAEELAILRVGEPEGDFFDALQKGEQGGKAAEFLSLLARLRTLAPTVPVWRLIERCFLETELPGVFGAMEGGTQRTENLLHFQRIAAEYESGEARGLSRFLAYLDTLEGESAGQTEGTDAVKLLSIHKSKGLEYPIVLLCDLARRFNQADLMGKVLIDPALRLGSMATDPVTRVTYPTIARTAIARKIRSASLSEELRVLYVAMTRPKNRLIMTYCSKYLPGELRRFALRTALPVPPGTAASASCLGHWVLMAALLRVEAGELWNCAEVRPEAAVADHAPWVIKAWSASELKKLPPIAVPEAQKTEPAQDAAALLGVLDFSYPYAAAQTLPSKVTATQLKGRSLDTEAAEEAERTERRPEALTFRRPRFQNGRRPLTAAERGTAAHLAMQFADYSACVTVDGARRELARLEAEQFLSPQQAEAVEPDTLSAFFQSEIGRRILNAKELIREFKFSILTDARTYFPDGGDEQVLLQGVADCCIVEPDGLTVVDFKTDRIRAEQLYERAEYYRGQLDAYSAALSRIFQKQVKERVLYFFSCGKEAKL